MKAIELIKSIRELNDDMVDAARNVSLDDDDDALVADLARWAAKRCGEDENDVLREVKAWAETDSLFPTLRDILEVGAECNEEHDNPPPPWKFRDFLGFRGMEERNEWYKKRVHITIHRGTKQIGGSITEINMGETNILVDFGSSLPGSQGAVSDDEIVKELFRPFRSQIDAVFFTHYHGDHTGLMDKIPSDVPIYMDSAMLTILRKLHEHTGNKAMQELLADNNGRIHPFTAGETLRIGDISVHTFFVDHSAYHANMFLFEGAGHTILHSGDFRSAGYMSKSLDIIPKLIHDRYHKQVDVLLTEGTMMTRSVKEEHLLTEWDVKKEATDFMRDHQQVFVICSSTNFDSLTSICRAAQANHLPIYGSPYIMEMLKTFSDMAGTYTGLYNLSDVQSIDDYLASKNDNFVILLGSFLGKEVTRAAELYRNYGKNRRHYQPYLIYSMWQGYLNPKHQAYNEGLATFVRQFDGRVKYIHSSGHADKDTLAKFIEDIAPQKYIVPFHTENPAGFRELNVEGKYRDMMIFPQDGDTIDVAEGEI